MGSQPIIKKRVQRELEGRIGDLKKLWDLYRVDTEASYDDLGNIYEYGLAFDYVAPETFGDDQPEGYFRYQLSWGGPSDEFRIYADQVGEWRWSVYRIEYWFLDWFDGASIRLAGEDFVLIEDIFLSLFVDCGTADTEYQKALEG